MHMERDFNKERTSKMLLTKVIMMSFLTFFENKVVKE